MPITHALRMAIIDCLKTFPNIEDLRGRRALVAKAGLDAPLAKQISYGGPLHEFCALLVAELEEYGRLKNGRYALQAVIEAVRARADPAERRECELILKDLRREIMLANVAESARRRWYVLAAAMVLLMGLMVSARYVVAWYLVGNGHMAPADKVAIAQPTRQAATPVAPSAAATSAPTIAPSPTATSAPKVSPSPTATSSPAPTRTPMPTETRPASSTPSATHTPLPTYTAAPSPTWTGTPVPSPAPTRTLAPTATPTPQPAGLRRTIRLEGPEIAIMDTKGNPTFRGLAVECLDADANPLTDSQQRRLRVPLSGAEGSYTLPQGTAKIVLWVDPDVYGDWWSRFNTQPVDVTTQEAITLRIVPLAQPGSGEKPWPPIK